MGLLRMAVTNPIQRSRGMKAIPIYLALICFSCAGNKATISGSMGPIEISGTHVFVQEEEKALVKFSVQFPGSPEVTKGGNKTTSTTTYVYSERGHALLLCLTVKKINDLHYSPDWGAMALSAQLEELKKASEGVGLETKETLVGSCPAVACWYRKAIPGKPPAGMKAVLVSAGPYVIMVSGVYLQGTPVVLKQMDDFIDSLQIVNKVVKG